MSRDAPSRAGSDTDELGRLFADEDADQAGLSEQRAAARVRNALLGDAAQVPGLARYRLRRVLGEGAMGQVWLADDPELARQVAIKLLGTTSGPRSGVHAQRLAREARAMAKISHPNVLPVFDVGTGRDRDEVFIVMEYVDGETLGAWMARAHPIKDIVAMFVQAAAGLDAAHRAGLVHRDFKPANAMVGRDGRARVADFGLARTDHEARREVAGDSANDELSITQGASLTMAGMAVGTPLYMAPEQHRGDNADVRSDQYAFCVALYEALAGARPFHGRVHDVALAKQNVTLVPIPARRGVPDALVAVVRRGLAVDPAARWPSMAALATALRKVVGPGKRTIVSGAIAVAGLTGLLLVVTPGASDECAIAEHTWEGEPRQAVTRALQNSLGVQQTSHVIARLDEIERAWSRAADGACTANTGVQLCLRDAAKQLEGAAALLAADHATRDPMLLVDALPRPADCSQRTANHEQLSLGARELELRDAMADARANAIAGRVDEAAVALTSIRDEAIAAGPAGRSVAARAALELAEAYLRAELPVEATPWFRVAFFEASAAGDDSIALLAAGPLVLASVNARDMPSAEEWMRHTEAIAIRTPPSSGADQVLHSARGAMASARDDHETAEREFTALMRRAVESNRPTAWLPPARNLALTLGRRGAHIEAITLSRELVERTEEIFGADSNNTAARRAELGAQLTRIDREAGIAELRRAIEVLDAPGKRPTRALPTALRGLALALSDAGRIDEALAAAERAVELLALVDPDNDVQRAIYHATLGSVRTDAGDLERAQHDLDIAAELLADWKGTERGVTLGLLGDLASRRGDIDAAVAAYSDAIAVWVALGGHDLHNILVMYTNLAVMLHRNRRCDEAMTKLDEARGFAMAKSAAPRVFVGLDTAIAVAHHACGRPQLARTTLADVVTRVEPGSLDAAYVELAYAEMASADDDARRAHLAAAAAIASATGDSNLRRDLRFAVERLSSIDGEAGAATAQVP